MHNFFHKRNCNFLKYAYILVVTCRKLKSEKCPLTPASPPPPPVVLHKGEVKPDTAPVVLHKREVKHDTAPVVLAGNARK